MGSYSWLKEERKDYGRESVSTVLIGPSLFQGQASSCSHWMQSLEFQEQVRKQVEAEWNSLVEAAKDERDELIRRKVDHNEILL